MGLLPFAGFLQKAFSIILLLQGLVMVSQAFSILYFLIWIFDLRDGLVPFQQNYKILFHLDIRQLPELPKEIAGSHCRNVGAVLVGAVGQAHGLKLSQYKSAKLDDTSGLLIKGFVFCIIFLFFCGGTGHAMMQIGLNHIVSTTKRHWTHHLSYI